MESHSRHSSDNAYRPEQSSGQVSDEGGGWTLDGEYIRLGVEPVELKARWRGIVGLDGEVS